MQIRKVTNCALENVGELDFEYRYGGCNSFSFGILLCFDYKPNRLEIDFTNRDKECFS